MALANLFSWVAPLIDRIQTQVPSVAGRVYGIAKYTGINELNQAVPAVWIIPQPWTTPSE